MSQDGEEKGKINDQGKDELRIQVESRSARSVPCLSLFLSNSSYPVSPIP